MTLAVFASKAYVRYLECSDMERHLDAFLCPTFNHRGHNTHRRTNDLRHVLGKAELEVLDKVKQEGFCKYEGEVRNRGCVKQSGIILSSSSAYLNPLVMGVRKAIGYKVSVNGLTCKIADLQRTSSCRLFCLMYVQRAWMTPILESSLTPMMFAARQR